MCEDDFNENTLSPSVASDRLHTPSLAPLGDFASTLSKRGRYQRTDETIGKIQESRRQLGVNKNNTSGYKGVFKNKSNNWEARIYVFNEQRFLGTYDTAEEAARVYDSHAARYFGTKAFLNFPSSTKLTSK